MDSYSIPVLYEDNHIIVILKLPGILSQADDTNEPDLVNLLKADLKQRYNKPGNVFAGLVHRLDRPVGGVMVFAKTSKAASRLSESVRSRQFDKHYLAVVHGVPAKRNATLRHFLRKDQKLNKVMVYNQQVTDSKEAILEYTVLAEKNDHALIEVKLFTGRPHQIRAQLATIGHPLVYDHKYGTKPSKTGTDLALWSASLSFSHPTTKEWLTFKHNPPLNEYPWSMFNDTYGHEV